MGHAKRGAKWVRLEFSYPVDRQQSASKSRLSSIRILYPCGCHQRSLHIVVPVPATTHLGKLAKQRLEAAIAPELA